MLTSIRAERKGCVFSQLAARPAERRSLMDLRKHQSLFTIGEEDHHIYLIISGRVKTTTVSLSGRSCLVDIYAPCELLGMSCLVAPVRVETATAMTSAVVRKISEETFLSVLSDTRLCIHCLRYLARRQAESEQRITHLATVDSEHRLAISLLHLCAKMGVRVGHATRIDCPITQQELADMVGTTRSRVGYFLARFRARGLVGPKSRGCLIVIEDAIRDYLGGMAPETNGQ